MSPRRKSGLSPKHLKALEHLPDVLEALEALADQRERVASLTARIGGGALLFNPKRDFAVATIPAQDMLEAAVEHDRAQQAPPAAILDTPERREYEEAKRAGATIPDADPLKDPLRNATEAQRDRMAEQRALIAAERRRLGLPPSRGLAPAPEPDEDAVPVRVEELPQTVNGSAGAEEEPN